MKNRRQLYRTLVSDEFLEAITILSEEETSQLDMIFERKERLPGATKAQTDKYYKDLEDEGIIEKVNTN